MSLKDLAPVHLDELNATAALMKRVDRKYPLHRRAAEAVLEELPAGTRVLHIGGRAEFGYTSVYFDTTSRDSYLLAARGRPPPVQGTGPQLPGLRGSLPGGEDPAQGQHGQATYPSRSGRSVHDRSRTVRLRQPLSRSRGDTRPASAVVEAELGNQLPAHHTPHSRRPDPGHAGPGTRLDRKRKNTAQPETGNHREQIGTSAQPRRPGPLVPRLPPPADLEIRDGPSSPSPRTSGEPLAPGPQTPLLTTNSGRI